MGDSRARHPRAPPILNARVAREMNASTSEQSVRESLAGTAIGEKNRCIRISVPDATGTPFSGES